MEKVDRSFAIKLPGGFILFASHSVTPEIERFESSQLAPIQAGFMRFGIEESVGILVNHWLLVHLKERSMIAFNSKRKTAGRILTF